MLGGAVALAALGARAAGEPQPRCRGPANGALLLMGGGTIGRGAARAARAMAGPEPRWVYIPTALRDEEIAGARPPAFATVKGLTKLHTRDRALADSEAFVAPLRTANAVYIEGGRQWRLADAYLGTRTEAELHALLARGGLIAGISAGAAIMASFLVRGPPLGTGLVVSPGHERGFGFISNCAIDEHVVRRGRQGDLAPVVAAHPGLLGLGFDEGAAAVVRGNVLTPVTAGAILVTDGADHGVAPFYALPQRARLDLATWSISKAPTAFW